VIFKGKMLIMKNQLRVRIVNVKTD